MISIHAPTWGATRFGKLVAGTDYISIHAPTWGATGDHFYPKNNKLFQSTLPRGERPPCLSPYGGVMVFQSTLPRGERPVCCLKFAIPIQFQSTLPRGERLKKRSIDLILRLFQSTLPRGERLVHPFPVNCRQNFNPRSHVGSDPGTGLSTKTTTDFNPRSHVGSDSNNLIFFFNL